MKENKLHGEFILPKKWCIKLSSKEINDAVNSIKLWYGVDLYWENATNYTDYYIGYDGEYSRDLLKNKYIEITFEQFNKYVLEKEPEFVLPEKWCIKSTSTRNKVGKWFHEHRECSMTDYFTGDYIGYYFHYPVIKGRSGGDYSFDVNAQKNIMKGYTEITYEQFIKYVLKQEETMVYRIKTKEEFIAEFGENFHTRVSASWNTQGSMDYLFGTEISKEDYDSIMQGRTLGKVWPGDTAGSTWWSISKDMITNKPLNKLTNMKQNFAISGTTSLKEAFIKECGIESYNSETVGYQYLTDMDGKQIRGTISSSARKVFYLPKDWDAALAYVKDYYTPVITKKVVLFGNLKCTIKKGDNFATTEFGKITKAQVKRILSMFEGQAKILGYNLELVGVDKLVLKFGCQSGTVAEAKALLKAFDE